MAIEEAALPAAGMEEDPYQVYTLRRPAERASTVVAQLPKHPEFTDTRLRYRRIARSGSLADVSYLPRRFRFPPRVSMLDTLSEDDASFAVRVEDGRVVRAPSAWGGGKDFVLLVETPGRARDAWEKRELSVGFVREGWVRRILRMLRAVKGKKG